MQEFITYLKNEKHTSDSTVDAYVLDVRQFTSFLGKDTVLAVPEDVRAYVLHMQSRGLAVATIRRVLSSLHVYFRYLIAIQKRNTDPTEEITRPENEHKLPMILSVEEVSRLIESIQGNTPLLMRDRAIIELLYATGITVSELIKLKIENINLRRRTLVLVRSERKRTIPFGRPCALALSEYMKKARPMLLTGSGEIALFLSYNGKPLSRQGLWKLIKKYKAKAGIDKEVTPHMLRHSFAAHLLEGGADLSSIQEMMGFIDPASTAIYTKIIENKIQDVYKKAHPRAN